ncbi:hypothetical protein T4B_10698 [Trichinella pseudospiralis]|uniref:Uncharacterized protein n=1 Tax=Trichinella pseudospiralis TaxID=6337 RepID=A0A0V1IQ14_TRIPS|nr:hypothetical protein T4B_10698 [Trichinella pseudospiralis]
MSAIIKVIPHIADEAANTKKKCIIKTTFHHEKASTTAANALVNPATADAVVFAVVNVVVEVFCCTQIITKTIKKFCYDVVREIKCAKVLTEAQIKSAKKETDSLR